MEREPGKNKKRKILIMSAPIGSGHRMAAVALEEALLRLKNVEVVDEDEVDLETINIGCKVKIRDMEMKQDLEYKIVGSTEANILKGKISNESPVGKALLGAKKGATVKVETQFGVQKYKVLEIERSN